MPCSDADTDVAHIHIDSPTSNDGQHHPPSSADTAVAGAASHSRQARRWKASSRECCCLVLLLSDPAQGAERGSMRGEAPGPFVQGERRAEAPHLCTALKANASRGQRIIVVGERDPVRGLHSNQVAVRNMITLAEECSHVQLCIQIDRCSPECIHTGAVASAFIQVQPRVKSYRCSFERLQTGVAPSEFIQVQPRVTLRNATALSPLGQIARAGCTDLRRQLDHTWQPPIRSSLRW